MRGDLFRVSSLTCGFRKHPDAPRPVVAGGGPEDSRRAEAAGDDRFDARPEMECSGLKDCSLWQAAFGALLRMPASCEKVRGQ